MRRAAAAAFLAALTACLGSPEFVRVPTGDARSMVVVFTEGTKSTVHAVEIPSPRPNFFSFPRPETNATIFVLHYACTLEKLGYPNGELPTRDEGAPLPKNPQRILKADSNTQAFHPELELPQSIKDLRVATDRPPPSPCTTFRGTLFTVEDEIEDVDFAVPLDEDRAFLGTLRGTFYMFDGEHLVPLTTLATTTPSLAAFRASDGVIHLIGYEGETAYGHPDSGFVRGPSLPSPFRNGRWVDLTGPKDDADNKELYAMSGDETFHRYDGTSWSVAAMEPTGDRGHGSALFLEPGLAAATALSPDELIIYDHGVIRRSRVQLTATFANEIRPGLVHPELGVVVGTSTGELYHSRDLDSWNVLIRYPVIERVRAFAVFGSGFLIGTDNGAMTEYVPDYGHCDIPPFTSRSIGRIIPWPKTRDAPPDRFLVLTDRRGTATFVLLEVENAPDACVP